MAITKTLIANSPNRSVFKIVATAGADNTTIALSDMTYTVEGKVMTPTKANITKVQTSLNASNNVTVVRNSATVLNLYGSIELKDFGLAEQNDQSAVVTFNTTGGTLIIEFSKVA